MPSIDFMQKRKTVKKINQISRKGRPSSITGVVREGPYYPIFPLGAVRLEAVSNRTRL